MYCTFTQNIEKQTKRITDDGLRGKFLGDVNALSLAYSPLQANQALALFFAKWEAEPHPSVGQVSCMIPLGPIF